MLERQMRFTALQAALTELTALEEDDSMHIGEAEMRIALKVLEAIVSSTLPPPKIFCHGGDCVVFTWRAGDRELLLSTGSDCIALSLKERGLPSEILVSGFAHNGTFNEGIRSAVIEADRVIGL